MYITNCQNYFRYFVNATLIVKYDYTWVWHLRAILYLQVPWTIGTLFGCELSLFWTIGIFCKVLTWKVIILYCGLFVITRASAIIVITTDWMPTTRHCVKIGVAFVVVVYMADLRWCLVQRTYCLWSGSEKTSSVLMSRLK